MTREQARDYAGHASSDVTDRVYMPAPTKLAHAVADGENS